MNPAEPSSEEYLDVYRDILVTTEYAPAGEAQFASWDEAFEAASPFLAALIGPVSQAEAEAAQVFPYSVFKVQVHGCHHTGIFNRFLRCRKARDLD
jgi:hypothetical protein